MHVDQRGAVIEMEWAYDLQWLTLFVNVEKRTRGLGVGFELEREMAAVERRSAGACFSARQR